MKLHTSFKKNTRHALLLGVISHLFGTSALATHQQNPTITNYQEPEYEKKATHEENTFDVFNQKHSQSKLANRCFSDFGFYNWLCDLNNILKNLEKCCHETHDDFKLTWDVIEKCCQQIQHNFEYTWSMLDETENTLVKCCAQTQNNFQTTFNLLNTLTQQSCQNSCWKLSIDEPGSSLANFVQTDGIWTTNGSVITTTAVPYEINALQYKYLQPAYQVLQVEIGFPNTQPPNVTNAVVGGLLFYWTGSDETQSGPLTCYMQFNTDASGQVVPGSSAVSLEVFRSGGGTGKVSYPILLDTYYQMTIIISPYNLMSVFINDVLIAQTNTTTSWPGQVLGGYVGFWAAFGTINFKNFKSWLPQQFSI